LVETAAPRPVAGWYMIAAIASLLFMMLGCVGLIMHVMTDPAALPLDQRALFEAEPKWVLAASAVGFLAGAAGALMLVLRRKVAERELFISLIAMLVWAVGMFATPRFRDLLSTEQIAVLIVVIALDWTIFWFARHSRQRGWLR
jgi:putative Mn2+ efflux pump MntP